MTTQEIIDYYADLLILQYKDKPKAVATIKALVTDAIQDQILKQIENGFNLVGDELAQGAQLDVLGKYVGVTRTNRGQTTQITLNDDDFIKLIQLKIILNSSNATLYSIQENLNKFFSGFIFIFDHKTMRLSYYVDSDYASSDLMEVIIENDILPKPLGVQKSSVIYNSILTEFFGMRTYEAPAANVSGFNSYDDYSSDRLMLNYGYVF